MGEKMALTFGVFGVIAFVFAVYMWSNQEKNDSAAAVIVLKEVKGELAAIKGELTKLQASEKENTDLLNSSLAQLDTTTLNQSNDIFDVKTDLKNKYQALDLELRNLKAKQLSAKSLASSQTLNLKIDRPIPVSFIPRVSKKKRPLDARKNN